MNFIKLNFDARGKFKDVISMCSSCASLFYHLKYFIKNWGHTLITIVDKQK
jgi:hypothetical protein